MAHLRFDDEYEPSDSEDEYTERDKELLRKVRNRKRQQSDSEDEVLGVGGQSDSDQSDIALSDIEGQEDDDNLPNERAWGKDKRKYYSTDYVDADYGGFDGKDAHMAELEEEEAKNLQKQLAQQLDDDDFSLDIFTKKANDDDRKQIENVIKTDISMLSKRQKLQILEKESPEFFGLVEDFELKLQIAQQYLHPIIQKYKKGQIANSNAANFVLTMYELILNYSTNIYMYLLLKSSRANIENHPIVKRLYQYRQLLSQMSQPFEEIIKPQIEIILQENIVENEPKELDKKKKKLGILKTVQTDRKSKKVKLPEPDAKQPKKKLKLIEPEEMETDFISQEEEAQDAEVEEDTNGVEIGNRKRAITYQMEKNKGLTPHRKKEQRNPRVKHRMKFRKAVIRRKGAVREPRREMSRYGGEISGIKATVSKSIKIKS